MATWQTDLQSAKTWVSNKIGSAGRAINDFFSGTAKKTVSDVNSFFKNGTTVVGINVNAIEGMKQEIRDYVKGIDTALAELKNYDPEVAFKGETVVPALKQYIEAVIETCGAITSNMLAFNDQLSDVQAAYLKKDEAAASTISKSAESTRSAYQRYTENGSSVQ